MNRAKTLVTSGIALAACLLPPGVRTCSVCSGTLHDPMIRSAMLVISVLLAIIGSVLFAFALFVVHLIRRSRMAALDEAAGPEA